MIIPADGTVFTFDGKAVGGVVSYQFFQGVPREVIHRPLSGPSGALPSTPDYGRCQLTLRRDPGGADLVADGDFDSADGWTLGDGWSIGSGEAYAVDPVAESPLSQTLTAESGRTVVVTLAISTVYTGAVRVDLAGETIIAATGSAGSFSGELALAADNPLLEIVASADFQGDLAAVTAVSHDAGQWAMASSLANHTVHECTITFRNGNVQRFRGFCLTLPITGTNQTAGDTTLASNAIIRINGPIY